jgi:hypothetical protein
VVSKTGFVFFTGENQGVFISEKNRFYFFGGFGLESIDF